jgi:hypothetical protein
MEQIVFPIHPICEFLTEESKFRVFNTTEQDEQGSKVTHFFQQASFLHNEMEWQKKLRSKPGSADPLDMFHCPQRFLSIPCCLMIDEDWRLLFVFQVCQCCFGSLAG